MAIREHSLYRRHAAFMLQAIWGMSEDKVHELVDLQKGKLDDSAARRIEKSFTELSRIIVTVISEPEYAREEQSHVFSEIIGTLHRVFKSLLNALIGMEASREWRSDSSTGPPTWFLMKTFYKLVGAKRGLPEDSHVMYNYPAVTQLVTFLRNSCEHQDDLPTGNLPIDHITGVRAFGNIYMLTSILALSIQAYIEIIDTWIAVN